MTFLLDTNVISEFTTAAPHTGVVAWLRAHQADPLHLSVVTIGEIRQGIARLPDSHKRATLTTWLENTLLTSYAGRLLPVDPTTMMIWGQLRAERDRQGRRISVVDALIAASARQHQLTLVTRNGVDFAGIGLTIINPWTNI